MGCELPRGIQPCDIDGIIEIGGQFLVMEHKRPNEQTKNGQRLLLKRLSNQRNFTVVEIVRGNDGVEEVYNYRTDERHKVNPLEFIQLVEKWAKKADSQ